jgi:hypothetical protein
MATLFIGICHMIGAFVDGMQEVTKPACAHDSRCERAVNVATIITALALCRIVIALTRAMAHGMRNLCSSTERPKQD